MKFMDLCSCLKNKVNQRRNITIPYTYRGRTECLNNGLKMKGYSIVLQKISVLRLQANFVSALRLLCLRRKLHQDLEIRTLPPLA